ncbi:MAG: TSUP family transporter [Phycisphaeraceae bacterium]|nr:TSUP family transporter [Phycisphaeraceae bacterium]
MIYALLGALIIGLALGLLGSGGGILTVPILVYLAGHERHTATAESLAIVGLISLISAALLARAGRVDLRRAAVFGIPGMAGAALGGWLGGLVPGPAKLALLAVIMLAAAAMMARRSPPTPRSPGQIRYLAVATQGLLVGAVTGLVGVGGGFLIVPALVLLGGVEMHIAIGTSLAIITLNSAAGLVSNLRALDARGLHVDCPTIALFAAIGIGGSLVGASLGARLDQRRLRQIFSGFLLLLAVFILIKEGPGVVRSFRPPEPPEASAAAHFTRSPARSVGAQQEGHPMTTLASPATSTQQHVHQIEPRDLDSLLRAGRAVIIDVREPVEHRTEHIAGSISLPLSSFDPTRVPAAGDKTIVLHCRSGKRSATAAEKLLAAGRESVTCLTGGLEAWKAAGLPIEKDASAPRLDLQRQTQITIGSFVLLWVALGAFVSPWFLALAAFMGAGLVVAGATGTCGMAMLIAKMPWNRAAPQS